MSEPFRLSAVQAGEIGRAMEAAGGWNDQLVKLLTEDTVADIRDVLLGQAEIKPVECLIGCGAQPFCPNGWEVVEHQKGGKVKWTKESVQLYLSANQKGGKWIEGDDLRKELAGKPVLNACVLDYLLAHPGLIPEEWKSKFVFFWGTIYRSSDGGLYVRFLYWLGGRWRWGCHWLVYGWGVNGPAALSASTEAL